MSPQVMKKVLLSITCVRTEVGFGERVEFCQPWISTREIEPAQPPHHPDVDRKRRRKSIAEKQDAIGDFPPHAR